MKIKSDEIIVLCIFWVELTKRDPDEESNSWGEMLGERNLFFAQGPSPLTTDNVLWTDRKNPKLKMCNVLLDQSRDHFKTQDLLVISWGFFFNLNVPFSII